MPRDPLDIIEHAESKGKNVPNYKFGPGFTAQGYYQITNPTWRDFARSAGVDLSQYPTAMSAPREVQRAVAEQIFKKRGFQPWKAVEHLRGQEANYQIGAPSTPTPRPAYSGSTPMTMPGTAPAAPASALTSRTARDSPFVREDNLTQAKIRRLAVNQQLYDAFHQLGEKHGLRADIVSGGQHAHGGPRTGSHRHDVDGGGLGAGDVKLFDTQQGRYLSLANPADRPRLTAYLQGAAALGATGFGAGKGYMGNETFHIGGGKPAVWGGEEAFLRGATAGIKPAAPSLPAATGMAANATKPFDPNAVPTLPDNPARGILADNPLTKVASNIAADQEKQQQQMAQMAAVGEAATAPPPPAPTPAPPPQPTAPQQQVDYAGMLLPRLLRGLLASSDYGLLGDS